MAKTTLFLAAALCASAAWQGCATSTVGSAPRDTPKFTVENTDRFATLDAATAASVSCTGLQERTLGDGRIEVVANLRNSGASAAAVEVACVFLDSLGNPLPDTAPWQAIAIAPSATEVVRFTAPSIAAKRYSIRARSRR